ncbi:hypothetical protein CLOP_g20251 [Closterium sp. NIES-67]|nr:hypothetical protein CLOP_g20251 [Closterium sp. NIES-67]
MGMCSPSPPPFSLDSAESEHSNHGAPRHIYEQSAELSQQVSQQQRLHFDSPLYQHPSRFHPSPPLTTTTPPYSTPPFPPASAALLPPASAPPRLVRARSPARRPSASPSSPLARPTPLNSRVWLAVELLCILAQISAGVCVLALFPHEKPPVPLRVWVLGYTLGCLLLLPLLYWRYTHRFLRYDGEILLRQQQEEEDERRRQWQLVRETPSQPAMASTRPVSPLRLPQSSAAAAAVTAVAPIRASSSSSSLSSSSLSSTSSPFATSSRPLSSGRASFAAPVAAQTATSTPYMGAGGAGGVGLNASYSPPPYTHAPPCAPANTQPWSYPGGGILGGAGGAGGVDIYSGYGYNSDDENDEEEEVYGPGRYSGFRHIAAATGERALSCVRWLVDELQDDARIMALVERYKVTLDCFFAVWFVLGNVWVFGAHSAATTAPNLYNLCVLLITLSCVGYALPFLLCAAICCCLPCLLHLVGYEPDGAFLPSRSSRGATTTTITALPSFKYRRLRAGSGAGVARLRGKGDAAAFGAAGSAGSAGVASAAGEAGVSGSKMVGTRSGLGEGPSRGVGGRPCGTDCTSSRREAGGGRGVIGGRGGEWGLGGIVAEPAGWVRGLSGRIMRRGAAAAATLSAAAAAGTTPASAAASTAPSAASSAASTSAGACCGDSCSSQVTSALAEECVDRKGERESASERREKEKERERGGGVRVRGSRMERRKTVWWGCCGRARTRREQ